MPSPKKEKKIASFLQYTFSLLSIIHSTAAVCDVGGIGTSDFLRHHRTDTINMTGHSAPQVNVLLTFNSFVFSISGDTLVL